MQMNVNQIRALPRRWQARLAAVLASVLLVTGVLAHDGHQHAARQPSGGMTSPRGVQIGGEVELLDHDGQAFKLGAPHDRRTLVLFGFTSCPSVCPTALADAQLITRNFGEDLAPRVVFITLDPERDSVAILKEYVQNFDQRFIALTGNAAQINKVTESYRVSYRRVPTGSGYSIDHSAYIYLLDERGRVERLYAHGTPTQSIIADLRKLAQQRSASR